MPGAGSREESDFAYLFDRGRDESFTETLALSSFHALPDGALPDGRLPDLFGIFITSFHLNALTSRD